MSRALRNITAVFILFIMTRLPGHGQGPLYVAKDLSFNKPLSSEIAPVITKDGILFCSDKRTTTLTETTTYDDEHLYHIYFAGKNDTLKTSKPVEIKGINNPVLYYGPLCIASDGKTVYFTSGVLTGKATRRKNTINPRGLYIGQLVGTSIVRAKPFEYNSTKYSIAQPSLSPDGKYLFFASDMPGGQGGSDLYYCELVNNKWSSPVNLGNKVNSIYKENYPYMHSSGRLYFNSDRLVGMGGMDVYYTTQFQGKWQNPVHLPAEINSSYDDFAFVADENMQTGYFASNRNNGNDDIFRFASTTIRKEICDTLQYNNYCYEFVDENATKFDSIPFLYKWNFGDGTQAEGIRVEHCFKGPGIFMVTLDVTNLLTKKVQKNEKTLRMEITDIEQAFISSPDVWTAGKPLTMNADSTNLPGWNIKLYYWNFGDDSVATGKEVSKTYNKPGTYNIQLMVTSEPDGTHGVRETCVFKNINVIR